MLAFPTGWLRLCKRLCCTRNQLDFGCLASFGQLLCCNWLLSCENRGLQSRSVTDVAFGVGFGGQCLAWAGGLPWRHYFLNEELEFLEFLLDSLLSGLRCSLLLLWASHVCCHIVFVYLSLLEQLNLGLLWILEYMEAGSNFACLYVELKC